MAGYNPFNAAEVNESAQRTTEEVFASSRTVQENGISSRFASSGKFTTEQLETGKDMVGGLSTAKPVHEEPEFDPDDKRSLYERLQAQKDAKQEEFDHAHQFKNQMDHWRLDADEAAFEDERLAALRAQEEEARRMQEEGAQFYKLARAARERSVQPTAMPQQLSKPPAAAPHASKRKAAPASKLPAFKVLKPVPKTAGDGAGRAVSEASDAATAAGPAPAAVAALRASPAVPPAMSTGGLLPGMGAYEDDSEEDDES